MRIIILKNDKTAVINTINNKKNWFYWNHGLYNIEASRVGRIVKDMQLHGSQSIFFQGSSVPITYQDPTPKPRPRGRPKVKEKTPDQEYLGLFVKLNAVKQTAEVDQLVGLRGVGQYLTFYNVFMVIVIISLVVAYLQGSFNPMGVPV